MAAAPEGGEFLGSEMLPQFILLDLTGFEAEHLLGEQWARPRPLDGAGDEHPHRSCQKRWPASRPARKGMIGRPETARQTRSLMASSGCSVASVYVSYARRPTTRSQKPHVIQRSGFRK
jgi:hypothetical protein